MPPLSPGSATVAVVRLVVTVGGVTIDSFEVAAYTADLAALLEVAPADISLELDAVAASAPGRRLNAAAGVRVTATITPPPGEVAAVLAAAEAAAASPAALAAALEASGGRVWDVQAVTPPTASTVVRHAPSPPLEPTAPPPQPPPALPSSPPLWPNVRASAPTPPRDDDLETDGEAGLSGGEAGNYPLIFGGVMVFVLACCGIIGCLVLRWQIKKRVAKKVGSMQQERAAAGGIAPVADAPADDGLMIWPDLVAPSSATFFGEGGGGEIVSAAPAAASGSPAGRYHRRQQTADSSRGCGAAPPPPAPGPLEGMRWSPGQRMVSATNLPAPTPSKELGTVAKIMFDRYDLDGSGAIDKPELAALCAQLGRDLNPVELDGVMAKLDTDGNGSVCFDEFMWWWGLGLSVTALQDETELAKLRQVAADGVARRQQVQDAAPTNATILEVFGTFDRDGSGTLDVKELSAALRELGLNLDGSGGLSTKGILARYGGDASRSIDVGEFTQLVLELHEAVVLHGSSTGKASVIQSERDEMRTTDRLPTGKGTASGKARARAALGDGGEKSSPGRRIYRPRPAGTSDADPFSQTLPQNFSGAKQGSAALARDASPRSAAALDPEPSDVQYEV